MPAALKRVEGRLDATTRHEAERFQRDIAFLLNSKPELVAKYADEWVAVRDQEVVAHAKELPSLLADLDELGIPRAHTLIDFLTTKDEVLIL